EAAGGGRGGRGDRAGSGPGGGGGAAGGCGVDGAGDPCRRAAVRVDGLGACPPLERRRQVARTLPAELTARGGLLGEPRGATPGAVDLLLVDVRAREQLAAAIDDGGERSRRRRPRSARRGRASWPAAARAYGGRRHRGGGRRPAGAPALDEGGGCGRRVVGGDLVVVEERLEGLVVGDGAEGDDRHAARSGLAGHSGCLHVVGDDRLARLR